MEFEAGWKWAVAVVQRVDANAKVAGEFKVIVLKVFAREVKP